MGYPRASLSLNSRLFFAEDAGDGVVMDCGCTDVQPQMKVGSSMDGGKGRRLVDRI